MTALTDLNAITHTANAKAVLAATGVNLPNLVTLAASHLVEAKNLINAIADQYPQSGGDASNYTALVAVGAELA